MRCVKRNCWLFCKIRPDFSDPDNLSEVFTASWLARRFAMQRNTASHYLNQLVAQDVLGENQHPAGLFSA